MALMRATDEVWSGKRELPREIAALRLEIHAAIETATLFMCITGKVDNGMVYQVVDLKLQLDRLYCDWAYRETAKERSIEGV